MQSKHQLKKGDIVIRTDGLIHLLCVIVDSTEDEARLLRLDQNRKDPLTKVPTSNLTFLSEETQEQFPLDLLSAIEKQREIVYNVGSRVRKKEGLSEATAIQRALKGADKDVVQRVLSLIMKGDK